MASDFDTRDSNESTPANGDTAGSRSTLSSDSVLHSGLLDNRDQTLDKTHDYHLDQDMGDSMEMVNANLHLGSDDEGPHYGRDDTRASASEAAGTIGLSPVLAGTGDVAAEVESAAGPSAAASVLPGIDQSRTGALEPGDGTFGRSPDRLETPETANPSIVDAEAGTVAGFAGTENGSRPVSSGDNDREIPTPDSVVSDLSAVSDIDATMNGVDESASIGATIGVQASADVADGAGVTYALLDDAGGLFSIDPDTGIVTVAGALDAETAGSHDIVVLATGSDGAMQTETFTIAIRDVNEHDVGPIDTRETAAETSEHADGGALTGISVTASDRDVSDTVSYSIDDPRFVIDDQGIVSIAENAEFDAESESTVTFTVTATSTDGSLSEQQFTLNIADENEYSVSDLTDTDGAANSIAEDASAGTQVGITALASDADASDSVTYSVDDSRFSVDENGVVTVAEGAGFDAETESNVDVTVTATSSDGSTSSETFSVEISDVNETGVSSPSDIDATDNAISEYATAGTQVGITAHASDTDTSDSVTYTVEDTRFAVDENGVVTVAEGAEFDFESEPDVSVTVTATSTDGSTSSDTFTVDIEDAAENHQLADGGQTFADAGVAETSVTGGSGDDVIDGHADGSTIDGGAGDDAVTGNASSDTLAGGSGNDTVTGGAGDDVLYGEAAPEPGAWHYQIYDHDFSGDAGQTDDITSGTLIEEGVTTSFDLDTLVRDARGSEENPEDFGVVLTSNFTAGDAGTYRFSTSSDDGSTIEIFDSVGNPVSFSNQDGSQAAYLDNDYHQSVTTRWGDADLEAGEIYTIRVRVWENAGEQVLEATVTPPGGSETDLFTSDFVGAAPVVPGDDILSGGAGNDAIDGGLGSDTAVFTGDFADYAITESGGVYTVTDTRPGAPDGTDSLTNIETFRFADGDILATDLIAQDVSAISDSDDRDNAISEDAVAGTNTGITASAADQNGSDSVSYSVDDTRFTVDENGVVTVAEGAGFDAETESSIDVTVTATSADGSTLAETYTISVSDVNEADVSSVSDTDGFANTIAENSAFGAQVGITAQASDTDLNDSVTYAVSDDRFTIDADGLVTLAADASFDHEAEPTINLTVTATSSDGSSAQETFAVSVSDVAEAYQLDDGQTTFVDTGVAETSIAGNDSDDTITAHDDGSEIYSGAGDDTVYGGAGDDHIIFGEGADTVYAGAGNDFIDDEVGKQPNMSDNLLDGGAGDDVIYSGGGDDILIGGDGNDRLKGEDDNDTLRGGSGNDSLYGGSGDDTIYTGTGGDYADGGDGSDTIILDDTDGGQTNTILDTGSSGSDTLILGTGSGTYRIQGDFSSDAGIEIIDGSQASGDQLGTKDAQADFDFSNVTLTGVDEIIGTSSGDTIIGSSGADTISLDAGDDVVTGGAGNDVLSGGDGSDLFMHGLGDGSDTIDAGAGMSWTDVIDLGGGTGVTSAGDFGTDWTVTVTSGSIDNTDTASGTMDLSQDADGYIDFADGSRVTFNDVEEIRW